MFNPEKVLSYRRRDHPPTLPLKSFTPPFGVGRQPLVARRTPGRLLCAPTHTNTTRPPGDGWVFLSPRVPLRSDFIRCDTHHSPDGPRERLGGFCSGWLSVSGKKLKQQHTTETKTQAPICRCVGVACMCVSCFSSFVYARNASRRWEGKWS